MSMRTSEEVATVKLGGKDFSIPDAEAFCRRFANGFFWIAGLSLINMVALATDADFTMTLGLGVPLLVQVRAMAAGDDGGMLMSYLIGGGATALFIFLGMRARRIARWPFLLGMSLYAVDSLIFLAIPDWVSFGFHLFWLWFLSVGLTSVPPILAARRQAVPQAAAMPVGEVPAFLREPH